MLTNLTESVTAGALAATALASPFVGTVGTETLLIAAHGAMGGAARWLFLREDWRSGIRITALGAILAAGVGNMGAVMIDKWTVDLPDSVLKDPRTAYSIAFMIGLASVVIMGRIVDGKKR